MRNIDARTGWICQMFYYNSGPETHTAQVKKNPHFLFFSMINCLFFWEK